MLKLDYLTNRSNISINRTKIRNILKSNNLDVQTQIKNNGKNLSGLEYIKRKQMIAIKKTNY
jgi:hypothetical protein